MIRTINHLLLFLASVEAVIRKTKPWPIKKKYDTTNKLFGRQFQTELSTGLPR